jgi:hypothetical protein
LSQGAYCYDGPLWRTLRSEDPDGARARVAFLSAHYGFRDAHTPIAGYEARLTRDLAERMIAGGMTTHWPRPRRRNGPDNAGVQPGAEIASMARYASAPFDDDALVGGGLYLTVMRAMLTEFQRMECVVPNVRVTTINGPIGRIRQDLRIEGNHRRYAEADRAGKGTARDHGR